MRMVMVILFYSATVVQDYNTFWVDIYSNRLEIVPNKDSTETSYRSSAIRSNHIDRSLIKVCILIEHWCVNITHEFLMQRQLNDPIYEGCGLTKTCVGFPLNCEQQQSCNALSTAQLVDDRFIFELQSTAGWCDEDSKLYKFNLNGYFQLMWAMYLWGCPIHH